MLNVYHKYQGKMVYWRHTAELFNEGFLHVPATCTNELLWHALREQEGGKGEMKEAQSGVQKRF